MEPVELAVGRSQSQGDGAQAARRSFADLGNLEFDARRKIYSDSMRLSGNRPANWLATRFEKVGDLCVCRSSLDIDLEGDRLEKGFVHSARHRVENPPVSRGSFSFTTVKNFRKGISLKGTGAAVDDRLHFAVPLKDCAWPGVNQSEAKTVQPHLTEIAKVHPANLYPTAVAVSGQGLELTRT
jgi:hypothetical protein